MDDNALFGIDWPSGQPPPARTRSGSNPDVTMRPRTLPDPARPVDGKVGRDHPETSQHAAKLMRYKIGSQKSALLKLIADAEPHGVTNAEAAPVLNMSRNQCATRMGELRDDGWVEAKLDATGAKLTRVATITAHGETRGVVHVMTIEGRIKYRQLRDV